MNVKELNDKIDKKAKELSKELKDIPIEDIHLILWNIYREKKDPGDFLLKKIGPDQWAR